MKATWDYLGEGKETVSASACMCVRMFVRDYNTEREVLWDIWGDVRQWHPTPVLLPGKSHGWRSLVGCSPWGREESETTEQLHFHFSLSCIGEGNNNPLQCSCLENPRDGGACWAAVYGVAQSWTRLMWLSSSSSSRIRIKWGGQWHFECHSKNNGCIVD